MQIAKSNLNMPIQWNTVEPWQGYVLWGVASVHMALGAVALWFLHKAFRNLSKGEFFNLDNSLNLWRFSILLFLQALMKPFLLTMSSLLLTINHPIGERALVVSFGSQELFTLALAMIIWVVSDVLVAGNRLEHENKQFV